MWTGLVMLMTTLAMTRAFLPVVKRAVISTAGNKHYATISRSTGIGASNAILSDRRSYSHMITTRFMSQTASPSSMLSDEQKAELETKIKDKGDVIRVMKEEGVSKDDLAPHVAELLALKAELDPSSVKPKKKSSQPQKQKGKQQQQTAKKQQQQQQASDDAESDYITPRAENYSKWYNDIIRVCGLAETSPVRGCMVIKPWGMSLWDQIRKDLDERIQEHGAENAYFPLLIPKSFLSKEAEHVDGFAKECAVVTHHRLTADPDGEQGLIADPEAELEDPLIIRPTSETMIWNMFKKWIVSHR